MSGMSEKWRARWPDALLLWGRYLRLSEPLFCAGLKEEKDEGLSGSFAMIRLSDHRVVLSPRLIAQNGLSEYPLEIMGHEIGHHVYCPADLTDMGRMLSRIRRGLPGCEQYAPMVGNLYTDLLINDRLFRTHGLSMDRIYMALKKDKSQGALWDFYMRTYEILWGLTRGTLTSGTVSDEMEGDARLANRVLRSYSRDWVKGAGRFALLALPYLLADGQENSALWTLLDSMNAGAGEGGWPDGLTAMDEDEGPLVHPALEEETETDGAGKDGTPTDGTSGGGKGQYREPFEYGQILKAMGINISDTEIAARYYKERAAPYLVPFPVKKSRRAGEPIPEGLSTWEATDPLEQLNWMETALRSPVIIPGVTTVETVMGTDQGHEEAVDKIDLDLYVDCSGSMPDPRTNVSYLTLAGTVIALSALRAGSRVQATLWSGPREFKTTGGFVRDEKEIMAILTDYFGGTTAFPIHIMRDTYQDRKPDDRRVHILHISDDGITTMFDKDEKGHPGLPIAREAMKKAGGGGSMALNLYGDWKSNKQLAEAAEMGYVIYSLRGWEDLVAFSRDFVKRHYDKNATTGRAG